MRRLPAPPIDFRTALSEAISGVGDAAVRANYQAQFADPNDVAIETEFRTSAQTAMLYRLPRVASKDGDLIVYGNLRKSALTKLYTQYFVPKGKPARQLYDRLKLTANGKCPLCGDIGHARTLDHYVPKANFPLYSVMPGNLIPCCRDCNTEKLDAFSTTLERQTLHPYFDDAKFFDEQWVAARVIAGAPPVIEYYISPPDHWSPEERSRVAAHFLEYGLAERFGVEAGADLPETINTRRTTLQDFSPMEYAEYLREKSVNMNLPVNNWRRVMFACLARDNWFCSHPH